MDFCKNPNAQITQNYCPNCMRFTKVVKRLNLSNLTIAKKLRNLNYIGQFSTIS